KFLFYNIRKLLFLKSKYDTILFEKNKKGDFIMKSSGIVGLVGGILLLICPFVLLGTAVNTAATTLNGGATAGAFSGVALLLNALKIANLVLGIIAIVYYKGDKRVGAAPSVLMIVSGEVSLIPFLGWVGGILAIIGGSLFLATLKKFKSEE
ncbi:integral membrane protein, partial [Streptococcus pneumoniae 1542]